MRFRPRRTIRKGPMIKIRREMPQSKKDRIRRAMFSLDAELLCKKLGPYSPTLRIIKISLNSLKIISQRKGN